MTADRVAIHVLTAYPPSNPNRDETGQPKTAVVGGKTRQRISSQCVKRAWRLSTPMQDLEAKFSTRTRGLGEEVLKVLKAQKVGDKEALARAITIASAFGKVDAKHKPDHSEMVVIGHEEWDAAMKLAKRIGAEKRDPTEAEVASLPRDTQSLDCALFGRMRAAMPWFNVEAAVSVSHPLTTNQANIEADFWTSVDDLKERSEEADQGSGGMGDVEYGSGIYYTYVEIDGDQLVKNLDGDKALADKAARALVKAIATTTPQGHRTTFGNPVRATYLRVEVGDSTGNLFCSAFETPVVGARAAIEALRQAADREVRAYGLKPAVTEMSVPEGIGTLADVLDAVSKRAPVAA